MDLASESGAGAGAGKIAVDETSVYWLSLDGEHLRALRTSRTSAQTQSLGSVSFDSSADQARVIGPVVIGDYVYAALSHFGEGHVIRADKSAGDTLSQFGPTLTSVSALTTDGVDVVLVLEAGTEQSPDARSPARIVRITASGDVHEVTQIAGAGVDYLGAAGVDATVSQGRVYWIDDQHAPDWVGTLWSAPLDGSSAPIKELTTMGNLLSSELAGDDDAVYFALYCRVDLDDNHVTGRTHIVRLEP